jgi:hypothetical protein
MKSVLQTKNKSRAWKLPVVQGESDDATFKETKKKVKEQK